LIFPWPNLRAPSAARNSAVHLLDPRRLGG
jgi:hypothetical protein